MTNRNNKQIWRKKCVQQEEDEQVVPVGHIVRAGVMDSNNDEDVLEVTSNGNRRER